MALAPIKAVTPPITNRRCSVVGAKLKRGANRFTRKPPALTIPACIKAETGVGASIVPTSQT
ncbi:MAG: hypothetical protein DYH03_03175 [Nitrospira sp. NTP1]|nr:hypothetical protein [Nitrospira sp. NTP1]